MSCAAATLFIFRSPPPEASAEERTASLMPPATPIPLPTQKPSPTPTETSEPTPTPSAAERVAKCKDNGEGGTVQLTANWKVGDTRTLEVVRYRQRFLQRRSRVIVQSADRYRITVLDATPTGYTLEWKIEDSRVQKGADVRNLTAEDMLLQDMLTLLPSLRIVYTTDINGAYQQIQNWDQVLAFHNQLHDLFNLRMEQTVRSKNTREQLMNATAPIWTDYAQIEQLYTQEIRAYHGIYGLSVGTLQSVRRADQLPSLLGNLPLESESEVKLSTFNPQSKCAFLDLRRYLTPPSMQQLLKDYLTRQTKASSVPSSSGDGFAATKIEDGIHYSVDMNSSWLQAAQMRRVTMVENLNMIDGIIIVDRNTNTP
ncbi:MAG: hypothetical protein U0175_28080 [Caldilineaceae bacterium]